jgi:hypothetical protein
MIALLCEWAKIYKLEWGVGRGAWGVGRGAWGVGRGAANDAAPTCCQALSVFAHSLHQARVGLLGAADDTILNIACKTQHTNSHRMCRVRRVAGIDRGTRRGTSARVSRTHSLV